MTKRAKQKNEVTLLRSIGYILAICGMIGLFAASVLMVEKIKLLQDPNYQPSCNLNPIISCGSVMKTDQASAFGISNSIIGIIGFSVITTIGFAVIAGAQFKEWFWQGLQVGSVLGVGFSMWLFYEGIYNIKAVCPYCAGIWLVTIAIFWYTLLYNLRVGNIPTPPRLKKVVNFAQKHHGNILITWYAVLIVIILTHFWYYWSTLI
jgi:uncharacterized membrane protein